MLTPTKVGDWKILSMTLLLKVEVDFEQRFGVAQKHLQEVGDMMMKVKRGVADWRKGP